LLAQGGPPVLDVVAVPLDVVLAPPPVLVDMLAPVPLEDVLCDVPPVPAMSYV
jgi:hypothetical protein